MKSPVANAKAAFRLAKPDLTMLPEYVAALQRGWSPDTVRGAETAREELRQIGVDPGKFIALLDDPEAKGDPVTLPDGSVVPRLPGFRRWLWDGTFCGSIGFRWQPGTPDLPPYVLGHIGYAVVPWKRGRGYAKQALALLLLEVRATGLPFVHLTADPENIAAQAVILANGGHLVERLRRPPAYGGTEALRFRITLPSARPDDALQQIIPTPVKAGARISATPSGRRIGAGLRGCNQISDTTQLVALAKAGVQSLPLA